VRPHFGDHDPNFRVITLLEPAKKEMITYLQKEHLNQPADHTPTRHARVEACIKAETEGNHLFELIVDLDNDKVVKKQHVEGKHSYIDTDYMKAVEAACLANEEVQALIKTLDLPEGATVVVEPWAYATDGMNDMTHRVSMVGYS
jgi:primary-amine oxidase